MNKKAVIYARVSTSGQKKGYSLDTQIEACKSYAKEKHYLVIDTFQDDYTGASIDRPGLNQLRDLLLRQEISIIIVYDIDRLARKSVYQMLIEEEVKRAGAVNKGEKNSE